jgi:hypothetical protein
MVKDEGEIDTFARDKDAAKKERVYLTFAERYCILPGIKSVHAMVFLCAQVVPGWLVRSPVTGLCE